MAERTHGWKRETFVGSRGNLRKPGIHRSLGSTETSRIGRPRCRLGHCRELRQDQGRTPKDKKTKNIRGSALPSVGLFFFAAIVYAVDRCWNSGVSRLFPLEGGNPADISNRPWYSRGRKPNG